MLKQRLKFLLKDTALYGVVNAASKFLSFLTIPIIVRNIEVSEFGIWTMLSILGFIASAIVIFGMDSAAARYHADCKNNEEKKLVFSHGFFIQLILVCAFLFISFFIPERLLGLMNINSSYKISALLIFIWVPANIFIHYFQNWFKWTFQRTSFLIISLGSGGGNFLFLFFYSSIAYIDINIILAIQAIVAWLFMLLGLFMCRKYFTFSFHKDILISFFHYGWPMMLVFLISVLAPSLDRMFLVRYISEDQLGIYSLCQKIASIMSICVVGFQMAFGPLAMSIWNKADAPRTFSRFQSYYISVAGFIALLICAFGKPLVILFGTNEYMGAEKYLAPLITGILIYGLLAFAFIGTYYSKRIKNYTYAQGIGIIFNYLFNYFFVSQFYEYAATIGFLLGNLVFIAIGYYMSLRHYQINYSWAKDILQLLLVVVIMFAGSASLYSDIWIDSILKAFIFSSIYITISFFLLEKNERLFILRKIYL